MDYRQTASPTGKCRLSLIKNQKAFMLIQPVVLSGGSGTRLWPLSREKCAKQLLPLMGEDSLL
jgi:hypothetical protein